MKFFGWKSAGRDLSRPVLSRGFSTWAGANTLGEWPRAYEPQVRDGYIGNPVAQRAVRLVAESVGSAPVAASDPAALALVMAKSGGQSLIETMAMHLLLHGNAYVQVLSDDAARPRELFALRPERVTVEADARGWPAAFLYKAGAAVTRLAAEDARGHAAVIHVKTAHPLDDHYGLGCLGAAAGAIAIHNAATRWNKALLDNAARPSGALVYEPGEPGAVLAAEQFARLRAELDASFAGAGNAGRPMLLEGGLKWQSLSLSPADMDFVGLKASAARDIALAFGVPPMLLGLPGDATYANYREANKALWRLSVLPMAGLILEGIAQGLRPHFAGLTLSIDPDKVSALSEDRERLWAQVEAASFLTLNEKRAAVGLGPVEVPEAEPEVEDMPEHGSEPTDSVAPVELKFNPYHDSETGRFTNAAGAGAASGGTRSRSVGSRAQSGQRSQTASKGSLFDRHSRATGQAGDVARAINRIVAEPAASVSLKLGEDSFSVRRKAGSVIELTTGPLGLVKLQGRFSRIPGKQGIRIDLQRPNIAGAKISSFPSVIQIFEHRDGRLIYSLDRDIDVTVPLLNKSIKRRRGGYVIPKSAG